MALPFCPLCGCDQVRTYGRAHGRQYRECRSCCLIHLVPEQRLSPAAERAHYATHQNDPDDARYRAFLSRLAIPLVERLAVGAAGLDFGSGPGPTLPMMLQEQGFSMELYDPFFSPDMRVFDRSYDFIACSETAEHFFCPGKEFERLNTLLRPGGWLGVMTEMVDESRPFEQWRYARDPTHVCFYRPDTMVWIAECFGWSASYPYADVVLFRKAGEPGGQWQGQYSATDASDSRHRPWGA